MLDSKAHTFNYPTVFKKKKLARNIKKANIIFGMLMFLKDLEQYLTYSKYLINIC